MEIYSALKAGVATARHQLADAREQARLAAARREKSREDAQAEAVRVLAQLNAQLEDAGVLEPVSPSAAEPTVAEPASAPPAAEAAAAAAAGDVAPAAGGVAGSGSAGRGAKGGKS